jgi:YegS/Rv2252/BmrU family lipid kinase
MRKALIILNPIAGKGEGLKQQEWLLEQFDLMDLTYDFIISGSEGEIERQAKEIDPSIHSELIIIGGDGSLVEAVNGLIGKDIKLGIVPLGTGNDFVRSLSHDTQPKAILEAIKNNSYKMVDIGISNDRYFINVTGFGIDSYILENMVKIKKYFGGSLAYFISTFYTLFKYKSKRVKIHIGSEILTRDVMLAAISNGQYFGGGMMISPQAKIDDGVFELVIVRKLSIPKFIKLFKRVYKGTHIEVDEVEVYKSDRFYIESDEKIPINVDGNLYGSAPLEVRVTDYKIKMFY